MTSRPNVKYVLGFLLSEGKKLIYVDLRCVGGPELY